MPSIQLEAFRQIAGSDLSIGDVVIADAAKGTLAKVNNHRTFTVANGVRIDEAESRAVKQAFVDALSKEGHFDAEHPFIKRLSRELGLSEGGLNVRDSTTTLTRERVRQVFKEFNRELARRGDQSADSMLGSVAERAGAKSYGLDTCERVKKMLSLTKFDVAAMGEVVEVYGAGADILSRFQTVAQELAAFNKMTIGDLVASLKDAPRPDGVLTLPPEVTRLRDHIDELVESLSKLTSADPQDQATLVALRDLKTTLIARKLYMLGVIEQVSDHVLNPRGTLTPVELAKTTHEFRAGEIVKLFREQFKPLFAEIDRARNDAKMGVKLSKSDVMRISGSLGDAVRKINEARRIGIPVKGEDGSVKRVKVDDEFLVALNRELTRVGTGMVEAGRTGALKQIRALVDEMFPDPVTFKALGGKRAIAELSAISKSFREAIAAMKQERARFLEAIEPYDPDKFRKAIALLTKSRRSLCNMMLDAFETDLQIQRYAERLGECGLLPEDPDKNRNNPVEAFRANMKKFAQFAAYRYGDYEVALNFRSNLVKLQKLADEGGFVGAEYFDKLLNGSISVGTLTSAAAHGFSAADIDERIDDRYLVPEATRELGAGVFNTAYLLTYRMPDGSEIQRVFKPELTARLGLTCSSVAEDYGETDEAARLNVANFKAAAFLGLGHTQAKTTVGSYHGQFGYFMELAEGHSGQSVRKQTDLPENYDLNENRFSTLQPTRQREIRGNLSRSACELAWADWLSGQIDRHGNNFMISGDGELKGIDNDASFASSRIGLRTFALSGNSLARFVDSARQLPGFLDGLAPRSRGRDSAVMNHLAQRYPNEITRDPDGRWIVNCGDEPSLLGYLAGNTFGLKAANKPKHITRALYDRLMAMTPADEEAFARSLSPLMNESAVNATRSRLREMRAYAQELGTRPFGVIDEGKWGTYEVLTLLGLEDSEVNRACRKLVAGIADRRLQKDVKWMLTSFYHSDFVGGKVACDNQSLIARLLRPVGLFDANDLTFYYRPEELDAKLASLAQDKRDEVMATLRRYAFDELSAAEPKPGDRRVMDKVIELMRGGMSGADALSAALDPANPHSPYHIG